MQPKALANHAPQPIASDCAAASCAPRPTCRAGRSARSLGCTLTVKNSLPSRGRGVSALEVGRAPQAPRGGGNSQWRRGSVRQRAASPQRPGVSRKSGACGPWRAGGQHLAAVLGGHAGPKSVRARATHFARLISTFHDFKALKTEPKNGSAGYAARVGRVNISALPGASGCREAGYRLSPLFPESRRWKRRCGRAACVRSKTSCPSSSSTPGSGRCSRSKARASCGCWRPTASWSTGCAATCSPASAQLLRELRTARARAAITVEVGSRPAAPAAVRRRRRGRQRHAGACKMRPQAGGRGAAQRRISPSTASSRARATTSPRPRRCRSRAIPAAPTTRCSSTAASGSARRT